MDRNVWSVENQLAKPNFQSAITIIKDKLYNVGGLWSDILFDKLVIFATLNLVIFSSSGSVECYELVVW